jgi:arginine/lysine/ornithine decarboxylase
LDDYPWQTDLTELPGLDDLSNPEGVLADLERRAAHIWGARETAISVNGASAGLAAAMLALAARGSTVLVPRNAHRSVIHGLVLSGLFPVWYEPVWDDDWGFWSSVSATSAERLLERFGSELAGMVVVAPTYAGALSDLPAVAEHCRQAGVPLIVDEAHGAHFVPGTAMPASAVEVADVVVHSLHKTLPALTQTGLLHVGKQSTFDAQRLRSALRLLQSSSPSYLLMASIEQALSQVEAGASSDSLLKLRDNAMSVRAAVAGMPELMLYEAAAGVDPAHILIGCQNRQPEELYEFLCERGIFPETVLGQGVLFLLGLGTSAADVRILTYALADFVKQPASEPRAGSAFAGPKPPAKRPPEFVQILSPRQAFLLPSEVIPVVNSVGRIACETVAPCPPGTPLIVAGQRVPEEILDYANLQNLRVVVEQ